MKICILGKYPPIQGGVSADNYWLGRALGRRGHQVFVVTNADEAGPDFREEIYPRDARYLEPDKVKVFHTAPLGRRFIPQYTPFIAQLSSLAIEVIKREKIDVLYSYYLLPYGVAAMLAKQATGVPWLLDHAGSDITGLYDEPQLQPIFQEIFKAADFAPKSIPVEKRLVDTGIIEGEKLLTRRSKTFYPLTSKEGFSPEAVPVDLSVYFDNYHAEFPVFAFLGKISPFKKTFELVRAAAMLPNKRFYLLFVTEGGHNRILLRNLLRESDLLSNACILNFQPPWRIPSIMAASTCVVCPESDEGYYLPQGTHFSKIALEAMLCGRCAIVGEGMSRKGFYRDCADMQHLLVVNPSDTKGFSAKLNRVVGNPRMAYEIGRRAAEHWAGFHRIVDEAIDHFVENLEITKKGRT